MLLLPTDHFRDDTSSTAQPSGQAASSDEPLYFTSFNTVISCNGSTPVQSQHVNNWYQQAIHISNYISMFMKLTIHILPKPSTNSMYSYTRSMHKNGTSLLSIRGKVEFMLSTLAAHACLAAFRYCIGRTVAAGAFGAMIPV